jgi:hypothetical protein
VLKTEFEPFPPLLTVPAEPPEPTVTVKDTPDVTEKLLAVKNPPPPPPPALDP